MQDSNLRPLAPKASAIPDYANSHFVIRAGFEPELIVPKTIVLPLHHRTIWADERNRTSVSYLEGRSNDHYTTSAFALSENYDISTPSLTVMCSASELGKPIKQKTSKLFSQRFLNIVQKFLHFILHPYPLTARNCHPNFDSVGYKVYALEFSLLIYI